MTTYPQFVFLALVALTSLARADEAGGSEAGGGEAGGRERYEMGLSAGRVREQDPGNSLDLAGYRIGLTVFSQTEGSRRSMTGNWYVEWKDSRVQEILEAGIHLSYPYLKYGWFGVGPRFKLAIQERADPPHRGTDGVFGAGLEVGVWVSRRIHVAAVADRVIGFETGARNSYAVNMRILIWGTDG